jgi:hypothetical protein
MWRAFRCGLAMKTMRLAQVASDMSNTPECYYQPPEFAMILDTHTGLFTHGFVALLVMYFRA